MREQDGVAEAASWLAGTCGRVTVVKGAGDDVLRHLGERAAFDALVVSSGTVPHLPAFVEEVRRGDPALEVVVVVATGDLRSGLACLRAGASDLLEAPLDRAALVAAAQRAVARRGAAALAGDWLRLARAAGLGQLIGTIAHEIANPVSIVTSSLNATNEDLTALDGLENVAGAEAAGALTAWWDADGRKTVGDMRELTVEALEGVQRLKLLARDLRAIARADATAPALLEVGEAVQAALRVARSEVSGHARVSVELPPGLAVRARPGALVEALLHVILNAAHRAAGRARGDIVVRARREEQVVLVEVEGDGELVDDPAARHLAPFLPLGAPACRQAMGLAVARELIEQQGGGLRARRGAQGGWVLEVRLVADEGDEGEGRAG
jgi:signal transduction histidine kinase